MSLSLCLNNWVTIRLVTVHQNISTIIVNLRFASRRFAHCFCFNSEKAFWSNEQMIYIEIVSDNIVQYTVTMFSKPFEKLTYNLFSIAT